MAQVARVVAVLLLQVGCGRSAFREIPTELVACWPNCSAGQDLNVLHKTPHALTWSWDATLVAATVVGYSLAYGTEQSAVEQRQAAVWGVEDDANLGWRVSPFGPNDVEQTTTSNLLPETEYHAHLYAFSADGSTWLVATGSSSTPAEASDGLVIFAEDEYQAGVNWLVGFEDPQDPAAPQGAHTGSYALWFDTARTYVKNGSFGGLAIDTTNVPAAAWTDAYIEFFVEIGEHRGHPTPIYYMWTQILGAGGVVGQEFSSEATTYMTLPARLGWHRVQVPLRSMLNADGLAATNTTLGGTLTWFQIGASWPADRAVLVDDVALRF